MDHHSKSVFMERVMAWAIDFILLEVFHLFLFISFTAVLLKTIPLELTAMLTLFGIYPLVFFVSFLPLHMAYFTLFHAWSGQTIGKMLMGIRVVAKDNKPSPPSIAFLRWTGYILSFIPLAAGFLWAAVDRDECAWHDRLAQTRVISTEIT